MKLPHTSTGITTSTTVVASVNRNVGPFHVVAGVHIGAMTRLPPGHNIDSILTVADQHGLVPDGVSHKHLPLSYQAMDPDRLTEAVLWTLDQVNLEHTVLIRSERGLQRPGLVAGMVILHMGGWYMDAISCVRKANPSALTDFRYMNLVRELDTFLRGKAAR